MGIKIFVGNTGYSEAGGKKWGNKGIKNFGIFLVLRRKTGQFQARLYTGYKYPAEGSAEVSAKKTLAIRLCPWYDT